MRGRQFGKKMGPLRSIQRRGPDKDYLVDCLFIHPDIFHAPAIVKAVHMRDIALNMALPARVLLVVIDDRTRRVFLESLVDFQDEFRAFLLVGHHRLLHE